MILISEQTKKCGACGKCAAGWLLRSARLEKLPPVFLCASCAEALFERARLLENAGVRAGGESVERAIEHAPGILSGDCSDGASRAVKSAGSAVRRRAQNGKGEGA